MSNTRTASAPATTQTKATESVGAELAVSGDLAETILATLDKLEGKVLGTQPVDSKGKPTGTALYLHMTAGLPIDPKQFANPWNPPGGDSLATALNSGQQAPQPSQDVTAPGGPP